MAKLKRLEGIKFGRLTVLDQYEKRGKQTYWLCQCECGNKKYISAGHLTKGRIKSCGCLRKEYYERPKCKERGTRLETIYKKMKSRCNNPNNVKYELYGGRGIKVCEEWSKNSKTFYEWAIQNGYKDNLTIDRIDVNGNYEPNNCRWATYKQQANNTRRNHFVEINGAKRTIAEWADFYGISYYECTKRLLKK